MGSFAAGEQVQVEVVAKLAVGDYGVLRVLLFEILKLGVELVVNDGVLFEPSNFALGGADFYETLAVLDNFESVAIRDKRYAIGDGSYAIMQVDLARRDIDVLFCEVLETVAPGEETGH